MGFWIFFDIHLDFKEVCLFYEPVVKYWSDVTHLVLKCGTRPKCRHKPFSLVV